MRLKDIIDVCKRIFTLGLFPLSVGLVFFAASLTPSLIPRGWLLQGALAGLVTALGYMVGRFAISLWRALELPEFSGKPAAIAHLLVLLPALALTINSLFHVAEWQNSVRIRVEMPPLDEVYTLRMVLLAAGTFLLLYLVGVAVQRLFDLLRRLLYRVMQPRTANVLGLILIFLLFFAGTRSWLVPKVLTALDESYETAQNLFDRAPPRPSDSRLPGSTASLVDWKAMGQPGRNFVLNGPGADAISAFTGRPARDPIRVYVGRAQDDSAEVRARLALAELQRLGAFEREILVVASPTGTGWLDPGAHDTLEYIHDGDTATVAVQYSYLQSPLALLFETDTGLEQAAATMHAVYGFWKSLPPENRPKFYIHGLSLGAWSSMYAFDIFQMINDPIDGALWAGPPFPSNLWNRAVAERDPDSPYVVPEIGDGELIRFTSQFAHLDRFTGPWGRMRIVYLQYASDAIVFFEPNALWRAPRWMREPPAPDVSPRLSFMPVVTQFQLALDMALAKEMPPGYGHNYTARHYIDAWLAATAADDWDGDMTARLKAWCGIKWGIGCRNGAAVDTASGD